MAGTVETIDWNRQDGYSTIIGLFSTTEYLDNCLTDNDSKTEWKANGISMIGRTRCLVTAIDQVINVWDIPRTEYGTISSYQSEDEAALSHNILWPKWSFTMVYGSVQSIVVLSILCNYSM